MPQFFDNEATTKQIDDLFLGEIVPSRTVSVAETCQEIWTFRFQDSVNFLDKGMSIFCLHVVKAAKVEDEVEYTILER